MKEPAYISKLRAYAKGELDEAHLRALEGELFGTNDRAVVILYAALVENALQRLEIPALKIPHRVPVFAGVVEEFND